MRRLCILSLFSLLTWSAGAEARQAAPVPSPAAAQAPVRMPAAGSGPVIRFIQLKFHPVDESLIDPQTYLYYIQTQPSRSSDGVWVPYDEAAEAKLRDDFRRLWATNFLDNLWIEVLDEPFDNGVIGKRVIYQHGGAPAREDRRLHRLEQGRAHQDRREDEGAGRRAAPRLVPRQGGGAAASRASSRA